MLMLSWRRQPNSVVGWLTVWAAVTTLLYASHIVYFRHVTWLLAVSDAVYTACNLTVYPPYLYKRTNRLEAPVVQTVDDSCIASAWLAGGCIVFYAVHGDG